jgi:hypothetical protein
MYKGYSLHMLRRLFVFALLVVSCAAAINVSAQLVRPGVPVLSLTGGSDAGYDASFYPDGRLWVPAASSGETREILIPVFIKNGWTTAGTYNVQGVHSFTFKMQYDSTALRPVGVVTRGQVMTGSHPNTRIVRSDSASLADGWQFQWDIARDSSYFTQISQVSENRLRGKRIRISGIHATRSLGLTGDPATQTYTQFGYRPLLYVKFQVIGTPGSGVSDNTAMAISPDSILYNGVNVVRDTIFRNDNEYPIPLPRDRYLGGNQYVRSGTESNAFVQTVNRGMMFLHIVDPTRLDFNPKPTGNPDEVAVRNVNGSDTEFELTRSIYLDPAIQQSVGKARQRIRVTFKQSSGLVRNMTMESDSRWLQFRMVTTGGTGSQKTAMSDREDRAINVDTRFGRVALFDQGIYGPNGLGYPDALNNNTPSGIDPGITLELVCDPDQVNGPDQWGTNDVAGRYTGYITFKSDFLDVRPVRLKVTFLLVRSPDENWSAATDERLSRGISINVRNAAGASANLMFGTGDRATVGADSLFGEFAFGNPPSQSNFFARWFPINAQDGSEVNGLGDLTGVFSSRDVRSIKDDTTIVYRCRYSAGGSVNYPVVVTWNPSQFPDGSQLFLRDINNGTIFGIDMRNATRNADGTMSYTITDDRITAFDIEYTPARAIKQSIFERGWNFISLPVRPSNNDYRVVFPNGQGVTPIKFSQSIYQSEEQLNVGIGYFLRFPFRDTSVISGILVNRLDKDFFPVRVYEGWNSVGALSVNAGIDRISFQPSNANTNPPSRVPFTGVYGYTTDRGYREVSELVPGKGYFIKVTGAGFYNLSAPTQKTIVSTGDRSDILSNSARIIIRDNASRENTLYVTEGRVETAIGGFELPPLPPTGSFDVRFANNSYVETSSTPLVRLQGANYPVSLSFANNEKTYSVVNAITGEVIGSGNRVIINDENVGMVRILTTDATPTGFGVNVAPNPVNGSSRVDFVMPEAGQARVEVFNAMGQVVATLFNGFATKGESSVEFNSNEVANGTYIVKVTAGEFVTTQKVNVIK